MSIFIAQGVCVGLKDETIEYMRDGKPNEFRRIGLSLNTFACDGDPETIEITEEQKSLFKPFQQYRFPVEIRAASTKSGGAYCRISIPKHAKIEHLSQNIPAANPGQAK